MVQSLPGFLNLCLNVCSPSQVLGEVYTEVLEAAYSLHRGPTDHKRSVGQQVSLSFFFCYQQFFIFIFSHTTQHNIISKIKQQTHAQHLKVQSKGRERGKDNKNTKVTPLYNHVYLTKNTTKPQWLKAWPHRLAPLYIHMRQFAGGYRSNMPLYTCVV